MTDTPKPPFDEKDVLFRLVMPAMDRLEQARANVPLEYVVLRFPDHPCGITTLGRYSDDRWESPWHDMPVIAELLRQLRESQTHEKQMQAVHDSELGVCQQHCELVQEVRGEDVTLDILQSLDWMRTDLNWRRAQTDMEADKLSPEMQQVTQLVEDLRAGKIVCYRRQDQ